MFCPSFHIIMHSPSELNVIFGFSRKNTVCNRHLNNSAEAPVIYRVVLYKNQCIKIGPLRMDDVELMFINNLGCYHLILDRPCTMKTSQLLNSVSICKGSRWLQSNFTTHQNQSRICPITDFNITCHKLELYYNCSYLKFMLCMSFQY